MAQKSQDQNIHNTFTSPTIINIITFLFQKRELEKAAKEPTLNVIQIGRYHLTKKGHSHEVYEGGNGISVSVIYNKLEDCILTKTSLQYEDLRDIWLQYLQKDESN